MSQCVAIPLPVEMQCDRPPVSRVEPVPLDAGPRPLSVRIGYDMCFEVPGPAPTAIVLMLFAHPEVSPRLESPERMILEPEWLTNETFIDPFGNKCARVIVPPGGTLRVAYDNVYNTIHEPEPQPTEWTPQVEAGLLPTDALPYLLSSRYCEVDRVSAIAWDLFGKLPPGGARALAINRWVFQNIRFGYRFTRVNKTAFDTYFEGTGVCRDMTHLAIAFCRAMNIPARYATGYLADIDADPDPTPMDFSAYYEVFLGNKWWPMDARHGRARVGRVLMARGRDATDVALVTSFGRHRLTKFTVVTEPAAPMPLVMPVGDVALARSA